MLLRAIVKFIEVYHYYIIEAFKLINFSLHIIHNNAEQYTNLKLE